MNTNIVTMEDMNFLAQQTSGNLNIILSGMTALMNDTDNKVKVLENQTWFQRMCRTISGKNKMTQQEIQRNHDQINMYMSQAMTQLFEMQCIDHQVMMSLGNQLNELYAEQIQLKQILGAFVSKLNEKIESVDNFHILNTEIEQGVYSDYSAIVSICKILAQMDKRCIQDYRKMNILQRSMSHQGILSDTPISLVDYLMSIVEIPMDDIGSIYIELGGLRGNFMANLILNMIENYHFLPEMARKLKNKQALIESVIKNEQLELSVTLSTNDVYQDLVNSKLDVLEGLVPVSEIQYNSKLQEAEKLFLEYKLDEAFDLFHTLAENGNGRAMYFMGEYYAQPYGKIIKNEEEAMKWRKKGTTAGDVLATLNVAYSLPIDDDERDSIFDKVFMPVLSLAEDGDIFAQNELADLYEYGYGCEQDEEKMIQWLKTSAEKGYWRSMNELGNVFYNKQDYFEAVKWYSKSAELGYSIAQNSLANCYYWGNGVNQDYEKAVEWYQKSALNGYEWGMHNLANCYYSGVGLNQSYSDAMKWYNSAYEKGNGASANMIGMMYYNGNGVPIDNEKEFLWMKRAAELGDINGQGNLANCYYAGRGTSKNINAAKEWYMRCSEYGQDYATTQVGIIEMELGNYYEAVKWFLKAAENGYADAQNRLGVRYTQGQGVEINKFEAFKWFLKAAEQGHMKAQANLAGNYYYGDGTEVDYAQAKSWLIKSAQQGYDVAKENLRNWFGEII